LISYEKNSPNAILLSMLLSLAIARIMVTNPAKETFLPAPAIQKIFETSFLRNLLNTSIALKTPI
jgi:hypothetical protein